MSLSSSSKNIYLRTGLGGFETDLLVEILSYVDESDLLLLVDTSILVFLPLVQWSLSTRKSLCMSSLLKRIPNSNKSSNFYKTQQQRAVTNLIQQIQHTETLKHLELSSLRNISGKQWLPCLQNQTALQSLNLNGCSSLDQDLLNDYLMNCRQSLRHLSLFGCVRVGVDVVRSIALNHSQLQSLSLGGCSQTIKTQAIQFLLERLQNLKHLDLQVLKNIKDPILELLPNSISSIDFSSCERLRLESLVVRQQQQAFRNLEQAAVSWTEAPVSEHKIQHLVLDNIGTPRRGLHPGALTYFALGRCLREVHLAGCEQVLDWEIAALAQVCGKTLTVFQMRASCIGNEALIALAKHCTVLAQCDVSACFQIGDEGILALCQRDHQIATTTDESLRQGPPKRRARISQLRSLKIACLPKLTNAAVSAIANLENLHLLDIHNCPGVTSNVLYEAVICLPQLIDVNGSDIADYHLSLSSQLRHCGPSSSAIPKGLRFVNGHQCFKSSFVSNQQEQEGQRSCCSVRNNSQRLNSSVPLQYMYHCVDCKLLPALNRGICATCTNCHQGHEVFRGSYCRFYCDCPFAVAGGNQCQSIKT